MGYVSPAYLLNIGGRALKARLTSGLDISCYTLDIGEQAINPLTILILQMLLSHALLRMNALHKSIQ